MSEKFDEVPMAGNIIEPGNAKNYKTGGWRAERPIHDPTNCLWIKNGTCGRCWIFCPDMSVRLIENDDGSRSYEYDYDYCKGCGICANECPTDSIKMEGE
ncbi:MAG: 4Fe-4S dicluster-binding protein [Candidatus Thorarchaeota archaeon]|jgi:pyruvate ferredoxin oxidoreductase delta subunit